VSRFSCSARIVFVFVLALLWLRRGAADVEPSEPIAPTQTLLDESGASIRDVAGDRQRATIDVDREQRGATAIQPTAIPRETIDVLVLDGISWQPIVGAEVRWANSRELGLPADPEEFGVRYDHARIERRVEPVLPPERGRRTTTDEHGIARIGTRVFPRRVSALLADRFGSVDVGDRITSPIRVYLTQQRAIAIQVVDGTGAPVVGVPVSLREAPVIDKSSELWLAATDDRGIAHAELALPRKPGSERWTVHARARGPCPSRESCACRRVPRARSSL